MKPKKLFIFTTLFLFLNTPLWVCAEQVSSSRHQMQLLTQAQKSFFNMYVKDIYGMTVINDLGEELGKLKDVAQDITDNSINAVIGIGGFLGIGIQRVPIPLDQIQLQDGYLVWTSTTSKDELKHQPEYQQSQFNLAAENLKLSEIMDAAQSGTDKISFQKLDMDNSGFLTQNEIKIEQGLTNNWKKIDINSDDQLDRAEFSAFETIRAEATDGQDAPQKHAIQ